MSELIDQLISRRAKVMGPSYTHFYERPLYLVKGEGVWLYDNEGKKYLDCYNNVPSVGHCNPLVVKAISEQAAQLNTHTRYLHHNIIEYGEMLTGTMSGDLSVCMLVCTGTEANDLAYRIASAVTGNKGIVITGEVYHGNSTLVAELSPAEGRKSPKPDFIAEIAPPDSYRGRIKADDPNYSTNYAADVDKAIDELKHNGHGIAMQLIEGAFENPGLFTPPSDYYHQMAAKTRAAGGLVVFDEVQSGLCRQGENVWSYQNSGIVPDIVTMGKPLGCGHPLAAVVTTPAIAAAFAHHTDYFNTFGGNPVSAAAGKAVLQYIKDNDVLKNVYDTGLHFRAGLRKLAEKYEIIGDIRGKGLFIGVELVKNRETKEPAKSATKELLELLREDGLLISYVGNNQNILKIRPPLVFQKEHADLALEKMARAFAAVTV